MSGEPDNLTPSGAWRDVFLDVLRASANVSRAARAAGVARTYVYEAKKADPDFAAAWAEAITEGVDELEESARDWALKGVKTPVFYKGRKVGYVHVKNAGVLLALLKAHRPDVYGNKVTAEHTGEVKVTIVHESGDPPYADEAAPGADPADDFDDEV